MKCDICEHLRIWPLLDIRRCEKGHFNESLILSYCPEGCQENDPWIDCKDFKKGEYKTSYQHGIVCPSCGHIENDPYKYHLVEDDVNKIDCESCGTKMKISMHFSVKYSTCLMEEKLPGEL